MKGKVQNMNKVIINSISGRNYYYYDLESIILYKNGVDLYPDREQKILNLQSNTKLSKDNLNNLTIDELKNYTLKYGFSELILELTTACNLRCKYCIYSNNYDDKRSHGNDNMTWETAKKSIDLYLNYIKEGYKMNPNRVATFSFYGGEPLLNYKILKDSVDYINENYDKEKFITFTTNGTLLDEDIINYIIDNDIVPVFSLDGNSKEHNRNRVFKDDVGSFDVVYNNILEYYKKSNKRAFVNIVFDWKTNLDDVSNFINNNKFVFPLSIAPVNPNDTSYYEKYTNDEKNSFIDKRTQLENIFWEALLDDKLNNIPFENTMIGRKYSSVMMRTPFENSNKIINFTGTCIPTDKLFVNVKGDIYPCEKIGDYFKIGDVYSGIDYNKMNQYIVKYNECISSCSSCEIANNCSMCFTHFYWEDDSFIKNFEKCNNFKNSYYDMLKSAITILEEKPFWATDFIDDYYSNLLKFVDNC